MHSDHVLQLSNNPQFGLWFDASVAFQLVVLFFQFLNNLHDFMDVLGYGLLRLQLFN